MGTTGRGTTDAERASGDGAAGLDRDGIAEARCVAHRAPPPPLRGSTGRLTRQEGLLGRATSLTNWVARGGGRRWGPQIAMVFVSVFSINLLLREGPSILYVKIK